MNAAPDPAYEVGRKLSDRHAVDDRDNRAPFDPDLSLLNYGEMARDGDWTLRSALNRLAQPEPARVSAVLDLVRRLDAPLNHVKKSLERHTVTCDRAFAADQEQQRESTEQLGGAPLVPYTDMRTADLARLVAAGAELDQLLAGYHEGGSGEAPLEHEEQLAVPLLAVAARFEQLAAKLATWALAGPDSPPVQAVDETVAEVRDELDRLGVPEETGWR